MITYHVTQSVAVSSQMAFVFWATFALVFSGASLLGGAKLRTLPIGHRTAINVASATGTALGALACAVIFYVALQQS